MYDDYDLDYSYTPEYTYDLDYSYTPEYTYDLDENYDAWAQSYTPHNMQDLHEYDDDDHARDNDTYEALAYRHYA